MALELETLQRLLTALLNLAVAVLAGAAFTRLGLCRDAAWSVMRRHALRRLAIAAAMTAVAADLFLLWLVSAATAEVPLAEAGGAVRTMLAATHLGHAWIAGMAGLIVAALSLIPKAAARPGASLLGLTGLAGFWFTRAMGSHAAAEGDVSLPVLADWLHLGLVSLWVGQVILAGALMLRGAGDMHSDDRRARAAYVAALSGSATLALIGIVVTGLYAAWRNLGSWENLGGTLYGNTLLVKLAFFGFAALLGGCNRFFVMPPWLARESQGQAAPASLPASFRRILLIEALALLALILLAAWLASTPPPGDAM